MKAVPGTANVIMRFFMNSVQTMFLQNVTAFATDAGRS